MYGALTEKLGSASRVLTKEETRQVLPLAGAIQRVMLRKWQDLIQLGQQRATPILWCYMSDGWACDISRSRSFRTPAGPCVRVGRFRAEFLAEKQILKGYDSRDRLTSSILISPLCRSQARPVGTSMAPAANILTTDSKPMRVSRLLGMYRMVCIGARW